MNTELPWDDEYTDWEATGGEEMNKLYEGIVNKERRKKSLVDYRDELTYMQSLINVCVLALTSPEWRGQEFSQNCVAEVLNDYVGPHLKKIEKGLAKL